MAELTKEELDEKYNHKDMPKIENYLFNFCGCLMKLLAIAFFGIGAVFLAIFVLKNFSKKIKKNSKKC